MGVVGDRVRPSGTANVASAAEKKQARAALALSLRDLSDAAESVVLRLSRITNPVERAKAAMAIREFTTGELAETTDGLFRDAAIEAYARGRADHGWYGYGALGQSLGISRARAQQVINGTWKKGASKESDLVVSIRESADRSRKVNRLAAAGYSPDEIAVETGLSLPAVTDLIGN